MSSPTTVDGDVYRRHPLVYATPPPPPTLQGVSIPPRVNIFHARQIYREGVSTLIALGEREIIRALAYTSERAQYR